MGLKEELEGISDPRERARRKARALVDASPALSRSFTRRGLRIEILDGPKLRGDLLEVSVRAWQGDVELPVDNPYLFANPPILIPDGSHRKEIDPVTGETVRLPNHREDPLEALQEIIVDAVLTVAQRKGWSG